jgi:hypothetical protein
MRNLVYLVTELSDSGNPRRRLVRARSRAQALAHVVRSQFDVVPATVADVVRLMETGATVENAIAPEHTAEQESLLAQ